MIKNRFIILNCLYKKDERETLYKIRKYFISNKFLFISSQKSDEKT